MIKNTACFLIVVLIGAFFLLGCGAGFSTGMHAPAYGFIYTDVKGPQQATSNTGYSKVGTAKAQSILGWIATGDASIEAAMQNGGITKIHHVDFNAKNILGIYSDYTLFVYGE